MDLVKLGDANPMKVREYVTKKFKEFNGAFWSESRRKAKCIEYYLATAGTPHGQSTIEAVYFTMYKKQFPKLEAQQLAERRARMPVKGKVSSHDWEENQQVKKMKLEQTLATLEKWKEEGTYQEGLGFFEQLKREVLYIDDKMLNAVEVSRSFGIDRTAKISGERALDSSGGEASFEAMVGIEQSASIAFAAKRMNWGEINAKLEESFRLGAWGSGSVSAKRQMDALGFSAEVQAAIAIGAQLNVSGELAWKGGSAGLALKGEGEIFVGARAELGASLSVSALEGINLAIKAGAFVGFSASVTGSCTFTYNDETLASVEASAGITFGVGAEFSCELSAPIFGPTKVEVEATLSLGLGTTASTAIEINFSEIGLAAAAEFRRVVYLPTIMRGYKLDLINQDGKNLYYLNKSIKRVEAEIASIDEAVSAYNRRPEDRRRLLMDS